MGHTSSRRAPDQVLTTCAIDSTPSQGMSRMYNRSMHRCVCSARSMGPGGKSPPKFAAGCASSSTCAKAWATAGRMFFLLTVHQCTLPFFEHVDTCVPETFLPRWDLFPLLGMTATAHSLRILSVHHYGCFVLCTACNVQEGKKGSIQENHLPLSCSLPVSQAKWLELWISWFIPRNDNIVSKGTDITTWRK